jgi:FkbM family methyltransferase
MGASLGIRIGDRDLSTVVGALFMKRHRTAALNMFRLYARPVHTIRKYVFKGGPFPEAVVVHTPGGDVSLETYSFHDVLTVNEIFCRLDYPADATDTVVVDFGSNIGISAAFFLSRNANAHAYLFEPLPANIKRLRKNLAPFADRYSLAEMAVGLSNDDVTFGWEDSGRYGGVGRETGNYITVPCVDSNTVLRDVVEKHGRIDVLKIDIETLEEPVTSRIPLEIAEKIGKVYVEFEFTANPLSRTHSMKQYGTVAQFVRLR